MKVDKHIRMSFYIFWSKTLAINRKLIKFARLLSNNRQSTNYTMKRTNYNLNKAVLAEKDKTGVWLAEQMDRNIGTVLRWMTNKVQPSVEHFYDIAKHFLIDFLGVAGIIKVVL